MGDWRVPGYSELRVLGEGAQGRVVLARHDGTGRPAAIKYLAARFANDAEFRERFRGEADLLRRLHHPFVARMYGLVETPAGAAIVMEAVDGASLKAVLAESGPLAPEAALAVLKGSLLGLAAAHDLGIVHRDYKPANVIVRGDGCSKLIDFGVAVEAGEAGRSGTPVYMAPEQWRGEPASPATDVYAATCVFFECVTGRRPYTAEDQAGLMGRHLTAPIPVADVPEPLRPLIHRGLAKSAWDRPLGAAAFVTELESAAAGAYGPDWESRGVRALAGATAALALLFPLSALGFGSGGAGAGGAGAAGTAGAAGGSGGAGAGTAGTATAGKGVLGALGAKGAAAVAGGVVVAAAAGGAAVYVADAKEKPKPKPIVAALSALNEPRKDIGGGVTLQARGQVVTVTGGKPALVRKIDQALRSPLEQRWATTVKGLAGGAGRGAYTDVVKPTILLRNDRLLSVWYTVSLQGERGTGWDHSPAVTVDLRTGAALRPFDLFRVPTEQGIAPLDSKIKAHLPHGTYCWSDMGSGAGPFQPHGTDNPSAFVKSGDVSMALAPAGLRVAFYGAVLGYASACGEEDATVPYAEVKDMIKPNLLAAVPYPRPSHS
ncbi:serine/threonine-protein kinase [Actinomadura verrucosospora]|uniref:non-specific serine/threonine protein kinase n=1 Tax=Actinomadura verrucosospora TaxID=46165 RepID=A0A7D3W4C3_ACTVE|nr:serine/threonine-protein kinase [Actinomadura verrucosospora]QKG25891.1 serine/threonine protein kinase [Actinomadura verrucosospora]